ncbi:MAG: hypothetical protein IPI34_09465 [bacterium]|nr:hypothetical protein [bacterium]
MIDSVVKHLLQQGRDDPRATYAYLTAAKLRFMCDAVADTDDVYIDEIVFRGYTAALAVAPADEAAVDKAPPAPKSALAGPEPAEPGSTRPRRSNSARRPPPA